MDGLKMTIAFPHLPRPVWAPVLSPGPCSDFLVPGGFTWIRVG